MTDNKIRDAIIEANRVIREEDENNKKTAMESDNLTKLLVDLLNWFFGIAIAFSIVFSIGIVAGSIISAEPPTDAMAFGCWVVFAIENIMHVCISRLQKRKPSHSKWFKWADGLVRVMIIVTCLYALVHIKKILISMAFVIVFATIATFSRLAIRALKEETDRAYLVSLFSAVTGIAAFIVSIVALLVSRNC